MIGSLMVNYVCRNNVPSFVLLKVFAKFNTLRWKYHKMLNTVTRLSIQYTRKLKWICDHEYCSTVTHLINSSYFCFNRQLNRDELNNNNNTIYTSFWRSYRWFLFIFKVLFGRQNHLMLQYHSVSSSSPIYNLHQPQNWPFFNPF